jgi:hypothetical protein
VRSLKWYPEATFGREVLTLHGGVPKARRDHSGAEFRLPFLRTTGSAYEMAHTRTSDHWANAKREALIQ